jgi:hypothetical protein
MWSGAFLTGGETLICYEFYEREKIGKNRLIGILPERRRDAERTDLESISRGSKLIFGRSLEMDHVYVVTVSMADHGEHNPFRREEILTVTG